MEEIKAARKQSPQMTAHVPCSKQPEAAGAPSLASALVEQLALLLLGSQGILGALQLLLDVCLVRLALLPLRLWILAVLEDLRRSSS